MLKPKVALVKDGFLPAGSENKRGRLSLAAIERLKVLAANGVAIEGYSVSKPSDSTAAPVVTRVKHDPNVIAELIPQTRGEDLIPMVNGKVWPIGIKGCCNTCKVSLTHCPCPSPKVWLDFQTEAVVTFKPRLVKKG